MRQRAFAVVLSTFVFAFFAELAQGGVVRYTGKKIVEGANGATQVAAASGAAVAGGTASAGHTTVGAIKTGVNATENGVATATGDAAAVGSTVRGAAASGASNAANAVKGVPSDVANGTETALRKVWHAIW